MKPISNQLITYINLLRPQQWLKNSFIWIGIIFGHAWSNPNLVYQAIIATIAFCFLASSVYIINDIYDYERDRLHPHKKHRPIPADLIKIPTALIIAFALGITGIAIGFCLSLKIGFLLLVYVLLNMLYSAYLKNIIILDVFIIAAGFMLRILVGTYGIGIPPSHWLLLCGMLLTLFLGFTKRRAEYVLQTKHKNHYRKVSQYYSLSLLDTLIGICASGVIISYSLYTTSPETTQFHHTASLIYTVPLVIYGLFRYLYLLYADKLIDGQDISKEIFYDKQLLLVILIWAVFTIYLLL